MKSKKIIIAGGGTGGHIFPAIAIAEELEKRGYTIIFAGSSKGFNPSFFNNKIFYSIPSAGVKNQKLFKIILAFFKVFYGILYSLLLLFKIKPVAVFGVGGYVSVPVVLAAAILRIPIYIQEQNVSVGIANRILGFFSRKIFLGFKDAENFFQKRKCVFTGNPLRKEFYSSYQYNPNSNTLLILGGSQGARAINNLIISILKDIELLFPKIIIVHQTGKSDFFEVKSRYQNTNIKSTILEFIDDMVSKYVEASLVIARSGAMTVSELIAIGRPAILIPYPRKGQNDQTENAYYLKSLGVAEVVEQGNEFKERFWSKFTAIYNPITLLKMHNNFSNLQKIISPVTIAQLFEENISV